eukprot:TRINITY_DN1496_c0_g1_i6.p1 TRINITY_DN1496_c0_g1~~TRINITY_DN1496_c0_g1_i6.p1  ORF type:complete len:309 (+),score=73.81 TRINITY_DN1496_c0_g1_i6:216-1142(+)
MFEIRQLGQLLKDRLPEFRFGFAYGSGIFKQKGYKEGEKPMLDLILAVDNSRDWHQNNIARNPSDYSFLSAFGPKLVANVQEKFGASIYYNPLVPFHDRLIKYGVIQTDHLCEDLREWKTLYVSGRLHKPVLVLQDDEKISSANIINLRAAVAAALLLLPHKFSELELWTKIAGLSYSGDMRMKFGENPNKVANIVAENQSQFLSLYQEHLPLFGLEKSGDFYQQDMGLEATNALLRYLPKSVVEDLNKRGDNAEDRLEREELGVGEAISAIVKKSSTSQTAKGLFTAGLFKSIDYSSQKLKKRLLAK